MFEIYKNWAKKNFWGKIIEFKESKIKLILGQQLIGVYVINKVLIYGLHFVYIDGNGNFGKVKIGEKCTLNSIRKLLDSMNENPISHGDIIVCSRPIFKRVDFQIYSHWAIYDEEKGSVIEYYSTDENNQDKSKPIIKETDITVFLKRENIIHTFTGLDKNLYKAPNEVILKAKKLMKDDASKYSLIIRNCQHFASYCKIGKSISKDIAKKLHALYLTVSSYFGFVLSVSKRLSKNPIVLGVLFGVCVVLVIALIIINCIERIKVKFN